MDKQNWDKIRSGDKQAFRLLFDEYYSPLCLYANSIAGDLDLSRDLVSECFVRIWEHKESIDIKSSVKNYLLLAVRNSIYSYLRSPENRKTDIAPMVEKLGNMPVEEYDLEKEKTLLHVHDLIDELPEQRKKILKLACFNGKTYKEIAEILGISVNTVNTQMSRAYRFLRDRLNVNDLFLWFFFLKIKINKFFLSLD